jgi:hypothetical protein
MPNYADSPTPPPLLARWLSAREARRKGGKGKIGNKSLPVTVAGHCGVFRINS